MMKLSRGTAGTRGSAAQKRYRPRMDWLEDRTVPTVYNMFLWGPDSALSLTGDVAGAPIQEQRAGSLRTTYEGDVNVDLNLGASPTMQFLPTSLATAQISSGCAAPAGCQPLPDGTPGSAPANYGGQVNFFGTAMAAIRGLQVSAFHAAAVPMTRLDPPYQDFWIFDSRQTLAIRQGMAAYHHPVLGGGTLNLANQQAQNQADQGFLWQIEPNVFFMYIPVRLTLTAEIGGGIRATLNITGEIFAFYIPSAPGGGGSDIAPALGYLATVDMNANQASFAGEFTQAQLGNLQLNVGPAFQLEAAPIQDAVATEAPILQAAESVAVTPLEQVFTELVL